MQGTTDCFGKPHKRRVPHQEVGPALNRARCTTAVLQAFLFALTLAVLPGVAAAAPGSKTGSKARPVPHMALTSGRSAGVYNHPFFSPAMAKLPDWVTLRQWSPGGTTRAPGDQSVYRQTILLSKSVPSAQFSVTPATAASEHPFWTADGRYIYFDSNRVDATDTGTTPRADGIYNIFRMFPDGSGLVQIMPDTRNQLDPAVSTDGSRLAFVTGGSFVSGSGTAHPVTSGFNLYLLNVNSPTVATPLTNVTSQFSFADVRHPSWSPGGDSIAFAGEVQGQTVYHIFVVNVSTGNIVQLTSGTSSDTAPAWSPDGHVIAFSTNASGYTNGPAPVASNGLAANNDIYTVTTNPVSLTFSRVTDFTAGGINADNYNPSWSSLGVDPLGVIPSQPNPNGTVQAVQLLAFATDRADLNNDGIANAISGNKSTDIYYLDTTLQAPAATPGAYADVTPETTGNVAHKLETSQPDLAMDPTEPDYNFDKAHVSNEDYPTWPQYQSSYRIAFQSDRGGTLELWAAALIDINAPALLKYDQQNNEIVHVALNSSPDVSVREVNAGDTVRFRVRAVDYQSGVESVFLQIKSPDSSETSADGQEHKIFLSESQYFQSGDFALNAPIEYDAQAVDAQAADASANARFKANGINGVAQPNWPGGNLYEPGDDSLAYSGLQNPPDVANWVSPLTPGVAPSQPADGQGGAWLQLYDDGPAPAGHEPPGETANDGVYSGTWTTPANFPSDWIIDVILRDRAVNPFDPTQAVNWKIYDNVWGFTTKPFQALSNVLYVDDYDTGQKFLNNRFGAGQFNNVGFLPTESYMTEFSPSIFPTQYLTPNGTTVGTLLNYQTTLGINSYSDQLDSDGSGYPPTQHYDIWRIQCRGPLPVSVLNLYAPYTIQNPPAVVSAGGPSSVLVAERCVIWHSPYTGDLFVGPGTLLDQATQQELTNFVQAGGRLMVCGQDVAWGLSLGGGFPTNPFLTNVLHATYKLDNEFPAPVVKQVNLTGARGTNPIGWETWYNLYHDYVGTPMPPDYPPASAGHILLGPGGFAPGNPTPPLEQDDLACNNQFAADGVASDGKPTVDGTYATDGSPAVVWYTDPTTDSRIVFSPFGWEGIVPSSYTPPGASNLLVLQNWRMEMMHNVLDYMRTGRLFGTVRVINSSTGATQPLAGVLVEAISPVTGAPVSGAVTQSDGSYIIYGLDATGVYALTAAKSGYVTQHAQSNAFHGSYQSRTDFFMTQAQPGAISGLVLTQVGNNPVGGAIVQATDTTDPTNPNPPTYTGTSNAQTGSYSITVPGNATYSLAVTNAASLGYSGTVEGTYTGIQVTSAATVTGKNFHLKQLPGTVTGKVDIADASGNDTGTPLPGATVTATATSSSTGTPAVFTATTASDGTYTLANVDVGTYSVVASASGYAASAALSVNVLSQQTASGVNFALKPIPPGSVTGLVATSTGIAVSGATVTVTSASGTVLATVTTGAVQTGTDPNTGQAITFNYTVPNVPAGSPVTVSAAKSGYTARAPLTVTVTVSSGVASNGANLILDPLAIFSNTLSMVSAPYTYPQDVAALLNVPGADVSSGAFQFIYWNTATGQYDMHPTPPADTFHLGLGYFMLDTNGSTALALTQVGTPAPQVNGNYQTFEIPLQQGWNMIGAPFTQSVDFTKLQIKTQSGALVDMPTAQTGANPIIGAALWTLQQGAYGVVYTLDPYRGYWLYAFQPCTLEVLASAQTGRAAFGAPSTRALEFASTGGNWKLDLNVTAGTQSASRAVLGVNTLATDQYDQYKMMAPPQPGKEGVSIFFPHTNWGRAAGNYMVDVRSTRAASWSFTVQSNVPGQAVTLTWPNLAAIGRRQVMLTDLDSNVTFALNDRAAYTIPAGSGTQVRHFQLTVQPASRPVLQLLNVVTNLASTRADGAATAAEINMTLTSSANLSVQIMHNGQVIRNLAAQETRAAGPVSLTWDLRSDAGILVPAGVYQVQVTAIGQNGQRVPRIVPLILTR